MNKHTLQEICDFFGMPMAVDENGEAYIFMEEPVLIDDETWCGNGFYFPHKLISDIDTHDYHILVKPQEKQEFLCPSCGRKLHVLFKPFDKSISKTVCSFCGKEIPQSLIDEMIEQAR